MTKTENLILEKMSRGYKTFNALHDGERVMSRIRKMIEEKKLTIVSQRTCYYWKSIGGANSRQAMLEITVEKK